MSRSGYVDDLDEWAVIRWRGAVKAALRGRRGQNLLRDLAEAMDDMPKKRLIADDLERQGQYCALGVVGKARGMDLKAIDPHDEYQVADAFNIAMALAKEVVFENDEGGWYNETPEMRWERMRKWVDRNLAKEEADGQATE